MKKRTMIFVMIVAAELMVWRVGPALAQDEQSTAEPSVQTQGAGQEQVPGQMRRGYPGYRLNKLDETPKAAQEKTNKIALVIEDERKQMKALGEDRSLTKEQKKEKFRLIIEATEAKIKALLPPAEQKKYEESREKARQFREAKLKKVENVSRNSKRSTGTTDSTVSQ